MMNFKWAVMLITLSALLTGIATAQTGSNVPVVREFIDKPYIPVLTTAPNNTVTSASCKLVYTGNPVAGNTLTISGPMYAREVYEFYSTTYTGDNTGVAIGETSTTTYSSLATSINTNSRFLRGSNDGSGTTCTLTARNPFSGHDGNGIKVDEALTSCTVTSLSAAKLMTTGASCTDGKKGALVMQFAASDTTATLWVKTAAGRKTANVWKRVQ
jgi:hypothetical protein